MKYKLLLITVLYFIIGCGGNDMKTHESGLEYKYLVHNENSQAVKQGDVLNMNLTYKTADDSILFNTNEISGPFRMILGEATHEGGSFEDGLSLLHLGDSIYFEVNANDFFTRTQGIALPDFIKPDSKLKFNIGLHKIEELEDVKKEQAELREKNKNMEQQLLEDYLRDNQIDVEASNSGVYFIEKQAGNGISPQPGDTVHLHYTGRLINGEVFDSSLKRDEPFSFVLGIGQVIPAWDESVAKMQIGQKVQIIAPSHTAYGPNGYSPIIPPYSTLIFDIELIGVN